MSILKYNKSTSVMHKHLKRHPLTLGEEKRKSSTKQVNVIIKDIRPSTDVTTPLRLIARGGAVNQELVNQ